MFRRSRALAAKQVCIEGIRGAGVRDAAIVGLLFGSGCGGPNWFGWMLRIFIPVTVCLRFKAKATN